MKKLILMLACVSLLEGCTAMAIMDAPEAKYDLSVLKPAAADRQVIDRNFGEPVESIHYTSTAIAKRDLHEYQVGIKHKYVYSVASGIVAIFTFGVLEEYLYPVAREAAQAKDSVRVYYGPDGKLYGSASYDKKINMWLPNYLDEEASFSNGFPCYDFTPSARKAMAGILERKNRPDLLAKLSNCLELERVQAANR